MILDRCGTVRKHGSLMCPVSLEGRKAIWEKALLLRIDLKWKYHWHVEYTLVPLLHFKIITPLF